MCFERDECLAESSAKGMFAGAIEAGLLDAKSEVKRGSRLEIEYGSGTQYHRVYAPVEIPQVASYKPEVWKNRIRWKKLLDLGNDNGLRPLLTRRKVTLMDDADPPF